MFVTLDEIVIFVINNQYDQLQCDQLQCDPMQFERFSNVSEFQKSQM